MKALEFILVWAFILAVIIFALPWSMFLVVYIIVEHGERIEREQAQWEKKLTEIRASSYQTKPLVKVELSDDFFIDEEVDHLRR